MKKKIALLLVLALCAALLLTGCAKANPMGSWTAEVRFADRAAQLDALSPDLSSKLDLSGLRLSLKLDLDENGDFNLYTEQASLEQLVKDLRASVKEAAKKSILETYGITEAQMEERMAELGMTLDQMTDQFFAELGDSEKPVRITGRYRWEDDALWLTDPAGKEYAYQAELTEETLTIRNAAAEDGLGFDALLPLEFQRKP